MFCLLSSDPHAAGWTLPERYARQGTGRPDDVAKGHVRPLPARCHKAGAFSGHVLFTAVANSLVRLMQIRLDDSESCLASRMETFRGQRCVPCKSKLVPDEPIQPANEACQTSEVEVPTSIPIRDGKLALERPKARLHFFRPLAKRSGKRGSKLVQAGESGEDPAGDQNHP